MQLYIDEFVLENLFRRVDTDDGPVYYRITIDHEGWVVVWPDGSHLHTYLNPESWLK